MRQECRQHVTTHINAKLIGKGSDLTLSLTGAKPWPQINGRAFRRAIGFCRWLFSLVPFGFVGPSKPLYQE